MQTAGLWTSIYWTSLTVGRFFCGLVIGFTSVHRLLLFCITGVAAGAALLGLHLTTALSFAGLALIGLASGPIFPSLIAATPGRFGEAHAANGVGFQIAGAALGQSLLPAFIGVLAHRHGLEIIGPALCAAALVLLITYTSLAAASGERTRVAGVVADGAQ